MRKHKTNIPSELEILKDTLNRLKRYTKKYPVASLMLPHVARLIELEEENQSEIRREIIPEFLVREKREAEKKELNKKLGNINKAVFSVSKKYSKKQIEKLVADFRK
ncbi:MAG: hypothetical protein HY764_01970 [Candidatus Portnoybacteria bacterium]|nr:hypothetical protein [Candidatus Portnoybacteria bacterium]